MRPGKGDEHLSEGRRKDSRAKGDRDKSKSKPANTGGSARPKAGDVGRALRSVYDNTLREDVPEDFLDLLGKLS